MPVRSNFTFLLPGLIPLVIIPVAIAAEIVPKNGPCPSGYHTQGHYCVGNRDHPPAAIPKSGPCPSGYHTQGHYCVGNRR